MDNTAGEKNQTITELEGDRVLIHGRKSRLKFRLLNRLFLTYTKVLLKTCKFEMINEEKFHDDIMFGFWHGDCYLMEMLLNQLTGKYQHVCAIVTANSRGDFIENTLRLTGADALRIPDGMEMKTAYKKMLEVVKQPKLTLALALDGPAGPLHQPKKLLFMLARESQKPVVYVRFTSKRVLRMKNRWDSYIVPLPFARITAQFEEIGMVDKAKLSKFDEWKGEIMF